MFKALPVGKKWKPAAMPLNFHLSLDKGEWAEALKVYRMHGYQAPPTDTYDLLKTIVYKTGLKLDAVRQRFEAKVRLNVLAQKRAPELIEWHVYWEALNRGDSRNISMALAGARVVSIPQQIGVAEACAVLLQAQGKKWHETIVDEAPFATVTANNLLTISMSLGRWDIALEMLPHLRITKGDALNLWKSQFSRRSWMVGLSFLTLAPAKVVPHAEMVPALLEKGCSLQLLAERLEAKKSLTDLAALKPLVEAALAEGDWDFTRRCVDHMVDIGRISPRAHSVLMHLCAKYSDEKVFKKLHEANIPITDVTVELLEAVRWQ
jgi:hypothetical protein